MTIKGYQGKEIFIHEWTEVEQPVGVVQIVHGMAEHAGRYEKYARFLNERGYVVVADDHRGHGYTDLHTLGYCAGDMFADTVADEGEICKHYRAKYAKLPYFLFGFSYGSFIAQSFLASYGDLIDGVVIAGSNHKKDFEVYLGSFVAWLARLFGRAKKPAKLLEKLSFGAYEKQFEDGEWLSVDQENNEAYRADPLSGFACSYRFYADFFRGLRKLYTKKYKEALPKSLPVLLLSGENDPVGEQGKGVKRLYSFYQKAGMERAYMKLFEGSRHEFLNEKEGRAEKWNIPLEFFQEWKKGSDILGKAQSDIRSTNG